MAPLKFCQRGHLLTPENTITVGKNGNSRCRRRYNDYQRCVQQRVAFLQQQDPDQRQRQLIQNILRLRGATSVPPDAETARMNALIAIYDADNTLSPCNRRLTSLQRQEVEAELERREQLRKRNSPLGPDAGRRSGVYDPPVVPAEVRHIPVPV